MQGGREAEREGKVPDGSEGEGRGKAGQVWKTSDPANDRSAEAGNGAGPRELALHQRVQRHLQIGILSTPRRLQLNFVAE